MELTAFHGSPAVAPQVPGFLARTLLGFGAHGEVWLAEDRSSGAEVALKVGRRTGPGPGPDPAGSGGPGVPAGAESLSGLEQETALLCRIQHPHIVRLQRVVALPDGRLALVLDLASGGSLAALVAARGRFDPGEVSTLLIPLAGALEHLHRRGVVHGDIAPGNVLFAGDGRPQLGDLGAAQVLGPRLERIWSTPGFTDPALNAGTDRPDLLAADRWSLAAIGWFALTGRPPEPGSLQGGAAPADGESQRSLRDLLVRCLAPDPADRPGLDELADRAWQAAAPVPVRLVPHRAPDLPVPASLPRSSGVTRPVGRPGDRPGPAAGVPSGRAPAPDAGSAGDSRAAGAGDGVAGDTRGGGTRGGGARGGAGRVVGAARRWCATGSRPRLGVAAAILVIAISVSALALAGVRPDGPSHRPGTIAGAGSAPGPRSAADPVAAPSPGPQASIGLAAELSRALLAIGQARAVAFARASVAALDEADQRGSPAYRADRALVQRLKARGYRLLGVSYRVERVQVLARHGQVLEVRAVVTTSGHRQVAVASKVGIPVPPDGPRPVVFSVVAADQKHTGPARWRVRSVRTAS